MPLAYLLYRCPKCGQDPLEGRKDEAFCPSCGTRYRRGGEGGRIRVQESSGESWEVPSHRLTAALEALGGPKPRARDEEGVLSYRAAVEVRVAVGEEPVRHRGELLGFAERLEGSSEGVLEITDGALTLWAEDSERKDQPVSRWDLLDLRAVQTSSSSLQISPRAGGLVHFRFRGDSPRRWEELVRGALREAYRREGLGRIVEFQPRIVAELP